jgi:hypothetical protein
MTCFSRWASAPLGTTSKKRPVSAGRVRARFVLGRVDEHLDTLPKGRIAEIVEAGRGAVEQARRRTAWM